MTAAFRWVDEPDGKGLAKGAVVVSSFPSAGFAATVAAHYVLRALNLTRIGILESADAPPIAVVQHGEVQPPIRVYGRPDLAVVLSEFPPTIAATGPIARAILEGAEARQARAVICLEGVVPHPAESETEESPSEEMVWAVTSRRTPEALHGFEQAQVRLLDDGVIGGVSGALLVAGLHRALPVSTLLVSARDTQGYPDHRAGAAIIEALDRLLPELTIDTGPLRSQAEMIEHLLRASMKSRTPPAGAAGPGGTTSMYQ